MESYEAIKNWEEGLHAEYYSTVSDSVGLQLHGTLFPMPMFIILYIYIYIYIYMGRTQL